MLYFLLVVLLSGYAGTAPPQDENFEIANGDIYTTLPTPLPSIKIQTQYMYLRKSAGYNSHRVQRWISERTYDANNPFP